MRQEFLVHNLPHKSFIFWLDTPSWQNRPTVCKQRSLAPQPILSKLHQESQFLPWCNDTASTSQQLLSINNISMVQALLTKHQLTSSQLPIQLQRKLFCNDTPSNKDLEVLILQGRAQKQCQLPSDPGTVTAAQPLEAADQDVSTRPDHHHKARP